MDGGVEKRQREKATARGTKYKQAAGASPLLSRGPDLRSQHTLTHTHTHTKLFFSLIQ